MPLDSNYLILIIASLLLGLITQAYINHQYKKYSAVNISTGLTGAQTARGFLDSQGLSNIAIQMVPGHLTDHYDPRTNVVALSEEVFNGRSVAATAIACHECGHAAQQAHAYLPARLRGALVPVVSLASNLWVFVLIIGIFANLLQVVWVAVIMFGAVLLFQLVTLPVEFNASRRAMAYIGLGGYLPPNEISGARHVLTAAALTYVAGALMAVMQLLWLFSMARRR
ncbi:MAG: zinc metallopeptidase [Actinomycetia bacterium]|nr:zinc metallopeptidase [Actinomycetes bacterium]